MNHLVWSMSPEVHSSGRIPFSAILKRLVRSQDIQKFEQEGGNHHGGTMAVTKSEPYISGQHAFSGRYKAGIPKSVERDSREWDSKQSHR